MAHVLSVSPELVFKTLVGSGDRTGVNVFCVPADRELDLRAAAKASGNKRVELVPVKELLPITGYVRGGCSPIGMKKQFPTFVDSSAEERDRIFLSAGRRGMQLKIRPSDLVAATQASVVRLT